MPFSRLFVWVEGPDDQRFVDTILRREFEQHYDWVQVVRYAEMKKEKITKFIESIRGMADAEYIFLADNDDSPCISGKKGALLREIKSLQHHRIAVAVKEIECWYLAGLTENGQLNLEIDQIENTEHLTKEDFDRLRQAAFESRIDWMIEMLQHYSLVDAVSRNSSLQYFVSHFLS